MLQATITTRYLSKLLTLACLSSVAGCGDDSTNDTSPTPDTDFGNPQQVEIIGYPIAGYQSIQEPFISRDGQYLFFNSDQSEGNKELFVAQWDDTQSSFVFQGEIQAVNITLNVVRSSTSEAFGLPAPVSGIPNYSKFFEATTLCGDTLYYPV
jgi:hypothetical protein